MAERKEGVSDTGTIITGADRTHVASVYEPLLSAAITDVEALDAGASLYLYGSVANGSAEPPVSDVDLLTLGLEPALAAVLSERFSAEYGQLCRSVDIAPMSDLDGDSDEAYGNRVFLRHYCVHLAGPRRHTELHEYPADARAARGFNGDIALHAERWRAELQVGADPGETGKRAGRKTLLAVAGVVSIADDTWTTDRRQAAQRWSQLRPEWAGDIDLLAGWATGSGTPTSADVGRALDGVIAAVVDEFRRSIGLWDDA